MLLKTSLVTLSVAALSFAQSALDLQTTLQPFFPQSTADVTFTQKVGGRHGRLSLSTETVNGGPVYKGVYTFPARPGVAEYNGNVELYWGRWNNNAQARFDDCWLLTWSPKPTFYAWPYQMYQSGCQKSSTPQNTLPWNQDFKGYEWYGEGTDIFQFQNTCPAQFDLTVSKSNTPGFNGVYKLSSTAYNGAPYWQRTDGQCFIFWSVVSNKNRAWALQCAPMSEEWIAQDYAVNSWAAGNNPGPTYSTVYPWDTQWYFPGTVVTRNFDLSVTSNTNGWNLNNSRFALSASTFNNAPYWTYKDEGKECFIFWYNRANDTNGKNWALQCSSMDTEWKAFDYNSDSFNKANYYDTLPWAGNWYNKAKISMIQKAC